MHYTDCGKQFTPKFTLANHPYLSGKEKDYNTCFGKSTLIEVVEAVCANNENKNAIGERDTKNDGKFSFMTYKDVSRNSRTFALGIKKIISTGEKDEKIGLYATCNSMHLVSVIACCSARIPVVFVGPSSKINELVNILQDSEVQTLIVGSKQFDLIKSESERIQRECPKLKTIVLLEDRIPEEVPFNIMTFKKLCEEGAESDVKLEKPSVDDEIIMIYSSGTTASQKGMMYTNKNVLMGFRIMTDVLTATQSDVYLSFIPTTHIYGLCCVMACFFAGATVVFGSPFTLAKDLPAVKPTIFLSVPLVFEMFKKIVFKKMKNSEKWEEFNNELQKRIEIIEKGEEEPEDIPEIFGIVKKMFGGNIKYALSAAAALSKDTHLFFRATLGKNRFIQAYGASEITGPGAFQSLDISRPASCGYVMKPVLESKIVDIPELGYFVQNNQGELCFKGDAVISGYYKKPKLSKEVFESDGWYKTGDVVQINSDGTIDIIDRKKNIIKLPNGKYISLVNLELAYEKSSFVRAAGMCIFTNPSKSFIVAIVCVDLPSCRAWALENSVESDDVAKFLENEKMKEEIMSDFHSIHKENGLKGYEKIGKIALFDAEFGTKDGTATGSKKKKRRKIFAIYKEKINEMFENDLETKLLKHLSKRK